MKIRRTFQIIDTHTGGEPTRTVVGGLPVIPGGTMQEKFLYMQREHDGLRKLLSLEPRGNEVMSGAFLTPPCDPKADIGVLYYETGGWLPMCGHDTIGVATALVETGMVPVTEPITEIVFDTPSGLVRTRVEVRDHCAGRVSFINAPALVIGRDYTVDMPGYGKISFDVAWGGNMYAILPAAALDLELKPERAKEIVERGVLLREEINRQIKVRHPELSFADSVTHIEFSAPSATPGVSAQNAVVITSAAIDRSPCGTGTSAKMALLYDKGELAIGEPFVHESLIGSIFDCRIVETVSVAGQPAVIPEISGRAYLTGMGTVLVDPDDPFPEGFALG